MTRRVLIVEDEALVALTLEDLLSDAGFEIAGVADRPAQALEFARARSVDIAIVDVRLAAGGDGIALAAELARLGPTLILFATGNPTEVRERARAGHGCLTKPFEDAWLLAAIAACIEGTSPAIPGYFPLPVP